MRLLYQTVKEHALLFYACLGKVIIDFRYYITNSLSSIASLYLIFATIYLGASMFVRSNGASSTQQLMVDYIQWMFCIYCYYNISETVISTSSQGTIQKLYLSPVGYKWYLFYDSLSYFLITCLEMVVVFVVITLTIKDANPFSWHYLKLTPLLILSLISILGLGYVFGGIALIAKRINSFLYIFQYLFALLLITFRTEGLVTYIMPYAYGSCLMRGLMISGRGISDLTIAQLTIVAINSCVYMCLGVTVFSLCERLVLKRGSLGHY